MYAVACGLPLNDADCIGLDCDRNKNDEWQEYAAIVAAAYARALIESMPAGNGDR